MSGRARAGAQHPVPPMLRCLGALDVRAVRGVDRRTQRCRWWTARPVLRASGEKITIRALAARRIWYAGQACATVRQVPQEQVPSGKAKTLGASRGFRALLSCHICRGPAVENGKDKMRGLSLGVSHRQRQHLPVLVELPHKLGVPGVDGQDVGHVLPHWDATLGAFLFDDLVDEAVGPRHDLSAITLVGAACSGHVTHTCALIR